MKKKILSQMMILSFAFAGLFLVGNNVFADPAVLMPPDDQSGGGGITCAGPDKNWGDCLYCRREQVYMPTQGWGWGWDCTWSGSGSDYCAETCPGWMSL